VTAQGEPAGGSHRSLWPTRWLACLSACILSALPLAVVLDSNGSRIPLDPLEVARTLLAGFGVTLGLLWLLRPLQRDLVARAIWLSWIFALFTVYQPVIGALRRYGASFRTGDAGPALGFTLGAVAVATVCTRPWQARRRDPVPLFIVAGLFLAANLYLGWSVSRGATTGPWRPAADALIATGAETRAPRPRTAARDIYYVILDGFGRADTLRQYYGLDLEPFISFLRSKGFFVADAAQSNYSQTFLSIGSTLNLGYVDGLSRALGKDNGDRRPLGYLIAHNALMQAARDAGYQVIGIASDYMATSRLEAADVCICDQYGLNEIDQVTIGLTPLVALPLERWTFDAHRRKVMEAFAALGRTRRSSDPVLVFAHIVAPHPPFVFGPDGGPRQPVSTAYMFNDGIRYDGTRSDYYSGYRDQAQFVARQVTALIETLLERPGPTPVIVLHADHGPGLTFWSEQTTPAMLRERMTIFAAYRFPDGPDLYPTITPVNGARLLANGYFGTSLSLLPDQSWFSYYGRPYDFIPVEALPPR